MKEFKIIIGHLRNENTLINTCTFISVLKNRSLLVLTLKCHIAFENCAEFRLLK